jgi:2-dehydro-3-deoxyphosphogluconate aldolase/(4S)-4-hydroxy-2-oxoglutarate aldolase
MAGALTPTEVITAWRAGADFVRIFPCANVGGPSYIRELKTAMPQIPMVPTGGVSAATAAEFFEAGASALGIGCELISNSALKSGNLLEITRAAMHYASIARAAREAA